MVNLEDDQGLVFSSIHKNNEISFYNRQSESNNNEILEGGSSQIYEFNIYLEKSSSKIKRSFMKLHDLYAKLGGIIKLALLFFSACNSFLTYSVFQIGVLKEIFMLEDETCKSKDFDSLFESRYF